MNTDLPVSDLAARIADPTDPTRLLVTITCPYDFGAYTVGAGVWVLKDTGPRSILDLFVDQPGAESLVVQGDNFEDAIDRVVAMVAARVGVSVDDVAWVGAPLPPEKPHPHAMQRARWISPSL